MESNPSHAVADDVFQRRATESRGPMAESGGEGERTGGEGGDAVVSCGAGESVSRRERVRAWSRGYVLLDWFG